MTSSISIRGVLLASAAMVVACQTGTRSEPQLPAYWPTRGWQATTPEPQGMDSAKLAEVLTVIRERRVGIHSLLIVRNGYIVLDVAFHPYQQGELHDFASVTKSITSTLVGAAIGRGQLEGVRQPVLAMFPERVVANRDERKERLTIAHLLTMTSGLDCRYRPNEITLEEMRASPDWIGFMLDLPMTAEPGTRFEYCSGGMHLLSGVISRATGASALAFAQDGLFGPLGISDVAWPADRNGVTHGWGDLHMHPRDAAKIGLLWLYGGRWEDRQLVPADWMHDATRVHSRASWGDEYGYGMWIYPDRGVYEGNGRGGQRISVVPSKNVVVVFTGGGFEPGDIGRLLAGALKSDGPLPENRDGVARLAAAVEDASKPSPARIAPPFADIAMAISGRTFTLDANALGLETISFTFADPSEASMRITRVDGRVEVRSVGLDGVPRLSLPGRFGLPVAVNGSWEEGSVFVLDYDEVANINRYRLRARFDADRLRLDVSERSSGYEARIEGNARAP